MQRTTIVGLGEVLWDVFPDGPRFGGAPANFACSVAELAGEKADVYLVSSVGHDDLGRQALSSLGEHGVDASYVTATSHPTGQVLVKLDPEGRASYEFPADTAWDNLAWSDKLDPLAARTDVVCFGTLAQRSAKSRETIHQFVRATPTRCVRLLDINLRPPFWNDDIVRQSLQLANVLKLNDEELAALTNMLGMSGPRRGLLQQLIEQFSLELVALTKGAGGAELYSGSGERSDLPAQSTVVADTVGAGDSFAAALAIGLLSRLPLEAINAWANRVAAFVCAQQGAAPMMPAVLRRPFA